MKKTYDKPPRLTRQFLRDQQWTFDNIQQLIEKYPNQWVMVYKEKVIAHGNEVAQFWNDADKLGLEQPFVHFVERDIHVY